MATKEIKNIVVSGASGTVGKELVRQLLGQGYQVVGFCHSEQGRSDIFDYLKSTQTSSQNLNVFAGDLTVEDTVVHLMKQARQELGSIDGFVNAVGRFTYKKVNETTMQDYTLLMDANFKSPWLFARSCLNAMLDQGYGRMVFISSASSIGQGEPGMGLYAASKAALDSLVLTIHQEVKATDICINAVLPSVINTAENRLAMPDADPGNWVDPTLLAQFISQFFTAGTSQIRGALIPFTAKI